MANDWANVHDRAGRASAAVGLALLGALLGGCSIPLSDLPVVGLPAGAPARPAEQAAYPAVHDIPAARTEQPLDPADQAKMESDLVKARERQAAAAGHPKPQDKPDEQ